MGEHRYPLTYEIRAEDPPLTRDEIERGRGMCDAAAVLGLTYFEDGSSMMHMISTDGRTGDNMPEPELFHCWTMMAKHLAESPSLHPNKRRLAKQVFDLVRASIVRGRG